MRRKYAEVIDFRYLTKLLKKFCYKLEFFKIKTFILTKRGKSKFFVNFKIHKWLYYTSD